MKNKTFLFDIIFMIVAAAVLIIINEFELIEDVGNYSFIIVLVGYVVGKSVIIYHYNKKDKNNNCEIN